MIFVLTTLILLFWYNPEQFFNIKKDSVFPDKNGNIDNPIIYSHIINRLIFILSLLVLVYSFIIGLKIKSFKKIDIYFFLIIAGYIAPHIIVWATSKHLVGIFVISYIYLYLKIRNNLSKDLILKFSFFVVDTEQDLILKES